MLFIFSDDTKFLFFLFLLALLAITILPFTLLLIKSAIKDLERVGLALLILIISTGLSFISFFISKKLQWTLFSYNYEHKHGSFKHPDRFTEIRTESIFLFDFIGLCLLFIGPFIIAKLVEHYFQYKVKKKYIVYWFPIFILFLTQVNTFINYLSKLQLQ